MAVRAKTSKQTERVTERVAVRPAALFEPTRPPRWKRAFKRFTGWVGRAEVSERLREEILAFAIFTLAVVATLPIIGLAGRSGLKYLSDGIAALLGLGAIAVPLGLSIIAVEIWRSGDAGHRSRRVLGGIVLVAACVGLLAQTYPEREVRDAGGYVGYGSSLFLQSLVGEVGAGLLFLALGTVGVWLVSGSDSREYVAAWRRIRARRQYAHELLQEDQAFSVVAEEGGESGGQQHAITPITDVLPPAPTISESGAQHNPPAVSARPVIATVTAEAGVNDVRRAVSTWESGTGGRKPDDVRKGGWKLPSIDALSLYESSAPNGKELEEKARRIEESLRSFKVEAKVREVFPGPAVTLFTLEPGAGVKVRRITELQNDLALALAATQIRIEAPVPGMARVGIEIPNGSISTVGLRETLESAAFVKSSAKLPLSLGRDVNGRFIIGDLTKMPHLLIAGSTGSGKSVCINGIIATFLLTRTPDELKMVMIDPKMVELAGYEGVPHLKAPVVTEMDKVVAALRMVLREMERRYQLFSRLGVRNIDGYELRRSTEPGLEKMPYLVVIIDELADLMMTTPDEVETILVRLAQMARATGIHLLIATQRPSVDVLTGLIKANVPARIAFAVTSQVDSRVILDMPGAERLLGRGDMLFMPADAAKPHRIQGSYIDDQDLGKLVKHWRLQAPEVRYEAEWADLPSSDAGDETDDDPLLEQALEIVKQQGTASASMLQRRLRIGYNRAARLIETMEAEGFIGPADGPRGRTLLARDDWDD
ncbi:MAG: DNA translocase FtsK [Chloroflexi bacterium]|nr:MAG: DNA translocase FtsK [Chloroflexota bacterium]